MKAFISRFNKDESGATAIEYGLIAGIVSIVIVTGLGLFGDQLGATFARIATAMTPTP